MEQQNGMTTTTYIAHTIHICDSVSSLYMKRKDDISVVTYVLLNKFNEERSNAKKGNL